MEWSVGGVDSIGLTYLMVMTSLPQPKGAWLDRLLYMCSTPVYC